LPAAIATFRAEHCRRLLLGFRGNMATVGSCKHFRLGIACCCCWDLSSKIADHFELGLHAAVAGICKRSKLNIAGCRCWGLNRSKLNIAGCCCWGLNRSKLNIAGCCCWDFQLFPPNDTAWNGGVGDVMACITKLSFSIRKRVRRSGWELTTRNAAASQVARVWFSRTFSLFETRNLKSRVSR
jgi:hypothetical protein